MQKFIRYIFPSEFLQSPTYLRAFMLGLMYLMILILQLFSYEKFPDIVAGFNLPGDAALAGVYAAVIICLELAALPYLLSMKLPALGRRISRYATIAAPILWLGLTSWQNFNPDVDKANAGLFGATIPTPVMLWQIAFAALWVWAAVLVVRELPVRK